MERIISFLTHTLMKYVLQIGPSPSFFLSFSPSLSIFLAIESIVLCLTCEKYVCYVERPDYQQMTCFSYFVPTCQDRTLVCSLTSLVLSSLAWYFYWDTGLLLPPAPVPPHEAGKSYALISFHLCSCSNALPAMLMFPCQFLNILPSTEN